MFIADPRGRCVAVNLRAAQLTGYSHDELLFLNIADLIRSADSARDPAHTDGGPPGPVVAHERHFLCQHGGLLLVEVSSRLLPDGHRLDVVHDIRERRQTEDALRQSDERLRAPIDAAPFGAHFPDCAIGLIQTRENLVDLL